MEPFDAELLYNVIRAEFTVASLQTHEEGRTVRVMLRFIHQGMAFGFYKHFPRDFLDRLGEEPVRREILRQIQAGTTSAESGAE